jgi:hypothetical protein
MSFPGRSVLQEGIRVYCWDRDRAPNKPRIWLSPGTLPAAELMPGAIDYCNSAFVPAEPWRLPTPEEFERLLTKGPDLDYSECVSIVRLPDTVLASFRALGIHAVSSPEALRPIVKSEDCQRVIEKITEQIAPFQISNNAITLNGIAIHPPGLRTVTFNRSQGYFIGLHVDSWDRLPYPQRHRATNRICINLSRENRFLLFLNLPIKAILNRLCAMPQSESPNHKNFIVEFMKRYPYYPVVKVRIAPGEAYIAPTENMIHDGCSFGMKYPTILLTFRGRFRVPEPVRDRLNRRA